MARLWWASPLLISIARNSIVTASPAAAIRIAPAIFLESFSSYHGSLWNGRPRMVFRRDGLRAINRS